LGKAAVSAAAGLGGCDGKGSVPWEKSLSGYPLLFKMQWVNDSGRAGVMAGGFMAIAIDIMG